MMYVELDIANSRSQVHEPDDLKRFSVRVSEPAGAEALASALGPLGQLGASDHAWINIGALRAASGRADVRTTQNGPASSTRWSRTPRQKAGSARLATIFAPTLISVTRPADRALDGQCAGSIAGPHYATLNTAARFETPRCRGRLRSTIAICDST